MRRIGIAVSAMLLLVLSGGVEAAERGNRAAAAESASWFDRATQFEAKQQYQQAIDAYSTAIELLPSFAAAYVGRANANLRLGRADRVLSDLDRAIVLDRRNSQAYNNRGMLHFGQGRFELAVDDLTQAIKLEANNSRYHMNRAVALARLKQHDRAIADYTIVVAAEPRNGAAYAGLGAAYYARGDRDRAVETLEKACSLGDATGCKSLKALQKGS